MNEEQQNQNQEVQQPQIAVAQKQCNRHRWIKGVAVCAALVVAFGLGYEARKVVVHQRHQQALTQQIAAPFAQNALNNVFQPNLCDPMVELQRLEQMMPPLPTISAKDNDKQIVVTAQLPTVQAKNVNLKIKNQTLFITADQERDQSKVTNKVAQDQRAIAEFQAAIPLPSKVNANQMQCTFKNGVLTVHIPKA